MIVLQEREGERVVVGGGRKGKRSRRRLNPLHHHMPAAPLQSWGDEDIPDLLSALDEQLAADIVVLSSWEKYKKEVLGGSLDWSPMHTSEVRAVWGAQGGAHGVRAAWVAQGGVHGVACMGPHAHQRGEGCVGGAEVGFSTTPAHTSPPPRCSGARLWKHKDKETSPFPRLLPFLSDLFCHHSHTHMPTRPYTHIPTHAPPDVLAPERGQV